jgi:multimeric flavodoxin WrbA
MREALKAGEMEGAETELIHLADYDLKPCEGCSTCHKTGDCVLEDDVEKLYEKVAEADAIIIGSPVYIHNVSALTKTFIERVGYLDHARDRAFRNRVGGAIAVAGRGTSTIALSQILLFYHYARMIMASPAVTVIAGFAGEGDALKDALKDTYGINDARELGKSVVQIAKATASLRT